VVVLDWLLSGRASNGERWDFASYKSRNVVRLGGVTVFHDHTSLENQPAGLTTVRERMAATHVMGTLVLVGPAVAAAAAALVERTLPPLTQHCFRACRNAGQVRCCCFLVLLPELHPAGSCEVKSVERASSSRSLYTKKKLEGCQSMSPLPPTRVALQLQSTQPELSSGRWC
jgi:hypothetical protein